MPSKLHSNYINPANASIPFYVDVVLLRDKIKSILQLTIQWPHNEQNTHSHTHTHICIVFIIYAFEHDSRVMRVFVECFLGHAVSFTELFALQINMNNARNKLCSFPQNPFAIHNSVDAAPLSQSEHNTRTHVLSREEICIVIYVPFPALLFCGGGRVRPAHLY